MNDPEWELLSASLDDALSPEEEQELERLLEGSAEARRALAELRADRDLLRQALDASLPEEGLAHNQRRILSRLPAEDPPPPPWWEAVLRGLTPGRLVSLGVPALAAAWLLLAPRGLAPPGPAETPSPAARPRVTEVRPFAPDPARTVLEAEATDERSIVTTFHLEDSGVDVVWLL